MIGTDELFKDWRYYLHESVVTEKTRADREGVVVQDTVEQLQQHLGHGEEYFVHFSELNKLGINPKSEFNTPIGIYGYPLIRSFIKQVQNNEVPFASDRRYMHIFKAREGTNVFKITSAGGRNDLNAETLMMYLDEIAADKALYDRLAKKSRFFRGFVENWNYERDRSDHMFELIERVPQLTQAFEATNWKTSLGLLWNFMRWSVDPTQRPLVNWTRMFMLIGIDGIVDYGFGIIHRNEPSQAVFFSKKAIEHVDTIINKERPEDVLRRVVLKKLKKDDIEWAIVKGTQVDFTDKYKEIARDHILNHFRKEHGHLPDKDQIERIVKEQWHIGLYYEGARQAGGWFQFGAQLLKPETFEGDYKIYTNGPRPPDEFEFIIENGAGKKWRTSVIIEDIKWIFQPIKSAPKEN